MEAKGQWRQFLEAQYLTDLEEPPAADPEEVISIDGLASDLEGEAEWESANWTGGLYIGSEASILGEYGRHREVLYVVIESVPLWVADFLSLAIRSVEKMSRETIQEVRVDAL